jgi:hypothetical protein
MFPGFLTVPRARKDEVTEPMTLWDWRFTPFGILSAPPPAGNTPARIMLQPLHLPVPPVKPIRAVRAEVPCAALASKLCLASLPGERETGLARWRVMAHIMGDETAIGSAGAPDRPGHPGRGSGEQSPLQTRAQFLKNRSWELVLGLNRGACARGGAQHGQNSESYAAVEAEWRQKQIAFQSLAETIEFLWQCHRRAPFLFFNGNTFADVGRTIVDFVFADLPTSRRRQVMSAVAHYIAGVLPWEAMVEVVESLAESADWKAGDRVQTLRGSTHGVILRLLADGRVAWRPDGTESELIALPESLARESRRRE